MKRGLGTVVESDFWSRNAFVDMYVKDFQCDVVAKDAEPEILKDTAATAWITGNNCLGKKHKVPQICLLMFTLF